MKEGQSRQKLFVLVNETCENENGNKLTQFIGSSITAVVFELILRVKRIIRPPVSPDDFQRPVELVVREITLRGLNQFTEPNIKTELNKRRVSKQMPYKINY